MVILKKIFLFSFILILSFSFSKVFAQNSLFQDFSVSLSSYPSTPSANSSVTLTLSSNSPLLDGSKITWSVNGKVASIAVGQKTFKTSVGSTGQVLHIEAIAETNDGQKAEGSLDIIPESVDLIFEPETYTPPFFKGKPALPTQATLKVVAIPDIIIDGKKISNDRLIFDWSKNDENLIDNSGVGRNILVIDTKLVDDDVFIKVKVSDLSSNILANTSQIISVSNPEIIFYENNPLYGVFYNKAVIGNYSLGNREELHLVAKPFSFSAKTDHDNLNYVWKVNDEPVDSSNLKNQLILRQTDNTVSGSADVSVDVTGLIKIFQKASDSFGVNFGQ